MSSDLFFRGVFCVVWLVFIVHFSWIRYSLREPTSRALTEKHANDGVEDGMRAYTVALAMFGPLWFVGIVLYAAFPDWVSSFSVPLPGWFRLMMVGVSVLSLPFLAWGYHALGKNLVHCLHPSKFLRKKDHVLVTGGPYRYVRHPIYSASIAFILALSMVAANWLVLLPTMAVTALVCALTGEEESMLVSTFGDEYREYMKKTPGFIPNAGACRTRGKHVNLKKGEQTPPTEKREEQL